jgi:hypothetical protein
MYTAGVVSTSRFATQAQTLIDLLTSPENASLRAQGGFLPAG